MIIVRAGNIAFVAFLATTTITTNAIATRSRTPIVESSTQGRRERALRNIDLQDLLVPDDPRVPNVDALADVSIPTPHGGRSVTNEDKSNASPRELFAGDDNVDEVTDVGILHRHGQDGPEALNVHDLGILLPISSRGGVDPLGRGMDKDAVGGIGRALVEATPTTSPTSGEACKSFVECLDGYAVVNGTVTYETCDEACGNDCCTGYMSCYGFTGKVCRDETSCMGDDACQFATISHVINSCHGDDACYACTSATISHVINSCNGPAACARVGFIDPIVGDITTSCNGYKACYKFLYYGFGGNIDSSCNGDDACKNGDIPNAINSCNGPSACEQVGFFGGPVGDITNSCNGNGACFLLSYKGTAGNIDSSCNGYRVCEYVAYEGRVGNIARSCNGYNSDGDASNNSGDEGGGVCSPADVGGTCSHVAKYGYVGDIEESCHGDGACYKVSELEGSYVGNIKSSCKGENACANAFTDGLLPEGVLNECCNKNCGCLEFQTVTPTDCKNPSNPPSTSPSTSPSEELSNSPSISPSVQPSSSPSKNPSNQPSTPPSTSPSTSRMCTEERNAVYMIRDKVVKCRKFTKLEMRKPGITSRRCAKKSNNGVQGAHEACRITCDTCPSGSCKELFSDEFSFEKRNESITKSCHWLKGKVESKITKICEKPGFGEHSPAREVCPVTCGTCP